MMGIIIDHEDEFKKKEYFSFCYERNKNEIYIYIDTIKSKTGPTTQAYISEYNESYERWDCSNSPRRVIKEIFEKMKIDGWESGLGSAFKWLRENFVKYNSAINLFEVNEELYCTSPERVNGLNKYIAYLKKIDDQEMMDIIKKHREAIEKHLADQLDMVRKVIL